MGSRRPRCRHTTDARAEKGLEVEPMNAVGDGEGEQKRGDTWTAARVGKTLEGEAPVGKFPACLRQQHAEAETW